MINNGKIKEEVVKKLIKVLSCLCFFLIGCEDNAYRYGDISVLIDPRLQEDDNGYYHLIIDTTNWQTLHRFSGTAKVNDEPLENLKLNWDSSHYWYIGDTLGYVVKRNVSALTGQYVYYDTTYVTQFEGFEVPTINYASYSNSDGEFNQMFAPVRSMLGDTVTIWVYYWDMNSELYENEFQVILD
jgi:hypothetical protein